MPADGLVTCVAKPSVAMTLIVHKTQVLIFLRVNCNYLQTILTLWGRVTHISFSKLTIIGSDNGLSAGRRQAIIWTIAGILFIGPLGTIQKKMHLKIPSVEWQTFCLGLNVLIQKCHLNSTGIPMIKIRWFQDCPVFITGIVIPERWFLYWDRSQH